MDAVIFYLISAVGAGLIVVMLVLTVLWERRTAQQARRRDAELERMRAALEVAASVVADLERRRTDQGSPLSEAEEAELRKSLAKLQAQFPWLLPDLDPIASVPQSPTRPYGEGEPQADEAVDDAAVLRAALTQLVGSGR